MSYENECNLLRGLSIFENISPATLKLLAYASKRVEYQPGEVVFEQGQAPDAVYIVKKGRVAISRVSAAGQSVELTQIGVGRLFGELSLLEGSRRVTTAKAVETTMVMRIEKGLFFDAISHDPQFALAVSRELAHRLVAAAQFF